MPVHEGVQRYSRDQAAAYLVSNVFQTYPFGQVMMKENADRNLEGRDIGMPAVEGLISGNRDLTMSEVTQITRTARYLQDFQLATRDASKWLKERDSEPTVADASTNVREDDYGTAAWNPCEIDTPVSVWRQSVDDAKQKSGAGSDAGAAVLDVFGKELKNGMTNHIQQIISKMYAGKPSVPFARQWDQPYGLYEVCSATNVYAGVRRSLDKNVQWRGNLRSTAVAPSFKSIVDYWKWSATLGNGQANGFAAMGRQGVLKVCFAHPTNFQLFRDEADAKQIRIAQASDTPLAKFGFSGDAVQYGDTWCFPDHNLVSTYVAGINPRDWTIGFQTKMRFSGWRYLPDFTEGAQKRYAGIINSRLVVICHNPLNQFLDVNVAA